MSWVKAGRIEVVELRDPAALRAALARPREWFAILNTLGEAFPAEDASRAASMLDAIKEYVRDGGVWWETGGGYPFYRALVPGRDAHFRTSNRAFCDFAALSSAAGRASVWGVQGDADVIYVPSQGELTATTAATGVRVGRYAHRFAAYAASGTAASIPALRMAFGMPHREALALYAKANGFSRGLTDKASPDLVEKLKRCILLKVSTRKLEETTEIARRLPYPVLFHIAHYLRGGFDKQYPDHLPPRPEVGTGEDLAELVRVCKERGHAFMPYTNPSWWCVNPKGPTFERVGDAPLTRTLEGKTIGERYGANYIQGYTVCAWHPAVRAANDVIREQFTKQYPVDVLFQDQIGARGSRFDANPAAPHPGAYLEGIHRIAKVDSKVVPLGTEDGHDRLIDYELMFCGLSQPWLPNRRLGGKRTLYRDLWAEGAWRHEPLTLFLAHDKALFYHHDLGGFIRDRLDLSITLVMGYGLSWWTHAIEPRDAERDWLDRLCRLQAAIGPRCAGRALDDFAHSAPGRIRSVWGDLEIIANASAEPYALDERTTIAPEGFVARSPDLEAGVYARRNGRACDDGCAWVIREKKDGVWSEWTAGAERLPRERSGPARHQNVPRAR